MGICVFPETTPVLIVGGGPVGLTLSILLSGQGVDHVLVEAHSGVSCHPKARGISARSMEIFRRCGLEQSIRRAGLPASQCFFYRGRTLVDPSFVRTGPIARPPGDERTPSPGLICSQDALEQVLLRGARELAPQRIRFAARLLSFTDDGEVVHAVVEDQISGRQHALDAEWLVGCDGAASMVRTSAGMVMEGPTGLGHFLSVRFQAPLGEVVADRASAVYFVTEPRPGGFMAIDNDRRWIYQYPFDPRQGTSETLTDHGNLIQFIRTAAGIPLITRPDAPLRPPLDPSHDHQGSGPGDRAPHGRLAGAAGISSVLDLIGPDFTLITQTANPLWQQQAATAVAAGIPVTVRALNAGPQREAQPSTWKPPAELAGLRARRRRSMSFSTCSDGRCRTRNGLRRSVVRGSGCGGVGQLL